MNNGKLERSTPIYICLENPSNLIFGLHLTGVGDFYALSWLSCQRSLVKSYLISTS